MPAKPFNKEVLSFHIPLARHVITPDTCILGTFSLIFHLPSLPPPKSNARSRSGRRLQREMDSTKKNIKNERVSNSMETFAGKKHLEKSRNPESTGNPRSPPHRSIFWTNPVLEARWLLVKRTQPSETWKRYPGEISLSGDRRMETGNPSCHT